MLMYDSKIVGNVRKRVRKEKRKSQEVISGLCGLSRSHLSMIEGGRKNLRFDTLWKIAYTLEISPSTLVRYTEEETLRVYGESAASEHET